MLACSSIGCLSVDAKRWDLLFSVSKSEVEKRKGRKAGSKSDLKFLNESEDVTIS